MWGTASGWTGKARKYRPRFMPLGWQAEQFAEEGAGVEETELLSVGESDLLSTLS